MADSPSELQLEIEKLERKHAEHPEGRFFVPLANAYRKMGDLDTAEALLRSGVERHPDYLSAHIVLGRCLADRGAVREAEEEFRLVLSEDSQNLIALRTLGELAAAEGRTSEAAEWYRELLAVDPMNEDARQALESLSGAPAPPELETEFRSGAGWWEAETASEAEAQPQPEPVAGPLEARGAEPPGLPGQDAEEPPFPPFGEQSSSEVVTETIAELYARQGLHERAAAVYRELIRRRGGDPALEQRLAELERMEGGEGGEGAPEEPQEMLPELTLEDEEAMASEPLDAEEDAFASSFAQGFGAGYGQDTVEVSAESAEPSELEPVSAAAEIEPGAEPGRPAEAVPSAPPAPAGGTIVHLLAGIAAWRPAAGAAPPPLTGSEPVTELEPERWEAAAPEAVSAPEEEPWGAEAQQAGAEQVTEPWEPAADEAVSGIQAEPWETGPSLEEEGELEDLPYLEEVTDSAGAGGTGSAEDEPFPWELPGAAPDVEEERPAENVPTGLDPFFVDDVEPAMTPEEPLPESAPPAEARQEQEPEARPSDPTEDEDLESFQAWLRSLKR